MAEIEDRRREPIRSDDEISFLAIGSVLLRYRRLIYALSSIGLLVGLVLSSASPRVYSTTAVFQPQISETPGSNLAMMASRFGFQVPSRGGEWGAPVYLELLGMRTLLEPIARDTVIVAEMDGRAVALMELLEIEAADHAQRVDRTIKELRKIIRSREIKNVGAVEVSVSTRWPSVSLALVQQIVLGVNRFNVETRRSQAAEERAFVELQVKEAELSLRHAEDRLLNFLQHNRVITGSPELSFEHNSLQRQVLLRQQVYTSLVQNLEEARIREVRDTPVITMMEAPKLASEPESRRMILKTVLGWLFGGFLGVMGSYMIQGWVHARQHQKEEARQFVELVRDATPRILRKNLFERYFQTDDKS